RRLRPVHPARARPPRRLRAGGDRGRDRAGDARDRGRAALDALAADARDRGARPRAARPRGRRGDRTRLRRALARALADSGLGRRRRRLRGDRARPPLARPERGLDVRARAALKALITGAAGQDGSYLAELLLEHGYEVAGVVRDPEAEHPNLACLEISLHRADLLDQEELAALLRELRPTEVYNLASPSFVPRSWEHPVETAEFAAVGVTALLEAVRAVDPAIRVYQASSSEIFGEPRESPQNEETPLAPV